MGHSRNVLIKALQSVWKQKYIYFLLIKQVAPGTFQPVYYKEWVQHSENTVNFFFFHDSDNSRQTWSDGGQCHFSSTITNGGLIIRKVDSLSQLVELPDTSSLISPVGLLCEIFSVVKLSGFPFWHSLFIFDFLEMSLNTDGPFRDEWLPLSLALEYLHNPCKTQR